MNQNIGCLGSILRIFGILPKEVNPQMKQESEIKLPYRLRDDFLSSTELSFYKVLMLVLENESVTVFTKVSLGDLFFVNIRDYKERMRYWNKINRKHVDFLICDRDTLKPIVAIELDDSTHARENRQLRDEFVNQIFTAAKLPLIHIKVSQSYIVSTLQDELKKYLNQADESKTVSKVNERVPVCPKCQIEMVVRETRRGMNQGQKFYGCVNYPRCKQTEPFL